MENDTIKVISTVRDLEPGAPIFRQELFDGTVTWGVGLMPRWSPTEEAAIAAFRRFNPVPQVASG